MAEPGRRYPLERSYAVSLAVAVISLVPFIVITTASLLYEKQVSAALGTTRADLGVIAGLSEAGYAFGALLGGDLAQRVPQRQLFLLTEAVFVAAAIMVAAAPTVAVYGAGLVLLGLTTGLLLIVALPPVIQRFPADRMPITAAMIDLGFFGASSVGPIIGGFVAAHDAWRWFVAALAGVAALVLATAAFTLPQAEAPNRGLRFDAMGVVLGFAATVLPLWGSRELMGQGFSGPLFWAPLSVGLVCFVALVLTEYRREEPLSPVKQMWTTYPLIGTLVATIAGGLVVTLMDLAMQLLQEVGRRSPPMIGIYFAPQIVGTLLGAGLLGVLLRTRSLVWLVLLGMVALIGGGVLLVLVDPAAPGVAMLASTALVGVAAGATVSPGLYLAGFSSPSKILGRIFALVELVRSVGDYILAPVMTGVARAASGGQALTGAGIRGAVWITVAIAGVSTAFGVALWIAGGRALRRPDLYAWLCENRPAVPSPPLLARLRRR